jgi:hypothetical protein
MCTGLVKRLSSNGAFESRLRFTGLVTVYVLSNGALARGSAIMCSSRYETCLVGFEGLVIMYILNNGALARGLRY